MTDDTDTDFRAPLAPDTDHPAVDPPTSDTNATNPSATAESQKKRRGRPPGSKNKPKPQKPQEPQQPINGVLNMDDLARLPDIEWLVPPLLMAQGVSVLHGHPGTCKTFLALALAGCCVYHLPLVPGGACCRCGLALYVAFEGLPEFKNRRRAWLRFMGLPEPDHDALKLINPRREKLEGIDGIGFDFSSEANTRNLIATGKRLSEMENLPVVLVVVDVLKEALPNQVESTKSFAAAGIFARMIADELGCQVLLLHHNTANTDNMRGPKNLEGGADTRISLKRDGNHLNALWAKNREGPTNFVMALRAHILTLGVTKSGEEITSLAVEALGVTDGADMGADPESKLRQIAAEMGDEDLQQAELIRRLKWSENGRGGRQREWVRSAIGDATEERPRLVHLHGNTYKHVWMRRAGHHDIVCCRQLTAEEANVEIEAQRQRLNDIAQKLKGKR